MLYYSVPQCGGVKYKKQIQKIILEYHKINKKEDLHKEKSL